jgi:hypothetical protein
VKGCPQDAATRSSGAGRCSAVDGRMPSRLPGLYESLDDPNASVCPTSRRRTLRTRRGNARDPALDEDGVSCASDYHKRPQSPMGGRELGRLRSASLRSSGGGTAVEHRRRSRCRRRSSRPAASLTSPCPRSLRRTIDRRGHPRRAISRAGRAPRPAGSSACAR